MNDASVEEADAFLLDVLAGRCRAQVVSTAAALGLADRLASGPRRVAELAQEVGCDASELGRLLDFLVCLGLCARGAEGIYSLTVRGQALRRERLGPLAAFLGAPEMWNPWSALRQTLTSRDGSAFARTHGETLYEYLERRPETAARYDTAIDAFTRREAQALAEHFDFSTLETLVDVGGGRGTTLAVLLERWPRLRGILHELPHVAAAARAGIPGSLARRLEIRAGDFRHDVPTAVDAYLLKHVLHNWDDGSATALLRRCVAGLLPHGRLLVIEAILSPHAHVDTARLLDLEMLVLTGGRERRKPELRRLFQASGLVLEHCRPLTPESWLLVGRPRA